MKKGFLDHSVEALVIIIIKYTMTCVITRWWVDRQNNSVYEYITLWTKKHTKMSFVISST